MASDSSPPIAFDPDASALPDELALPPADGGEVTLLLADAPTRENGWAPRVAVSLARAWARAGRRVFLMDGDPVEPRLHSLLDEPNGEGVTDAVLYGVSPSRMARMQEDDFLFAPAGTVAADPGSVLRHPRWGSVLAACREAGSTVILYLPAGVPGVDQLAGEGDRVLRLRDGSEELEGEPGVTVLHPGRKAAEAAPPGAGTEGASAGDRAARPSAATAGDSAAAAGGPSGRPEGFGKPVAKRRNTARLVLLVLLLGAAAALAAAWFGVLEIPGITPGTDSALLDG